MGAIYKTIPFFASLLIFFSYENGESSKVTHEVRWNPHVEEKFQFGAIYRVNVEMREYMNMICPQYDADATTTLRFPIYQVTQQLFENCELSEDAKIIYACDSPSIPKRLTLKFQKSSPNPLGFIFNPGHTYYYLAFVDNGAVVKHQCSNALRLAVNVHRNLPRTAHTHTQHVVSQLPDQSSEMSTQRGAAAPFSTTSKHRPPKLANSNFKSTEKMVLYGRLTELQNTPQPRDGNPNHSTSHANQTRCSFWCLLILAFFAYLLNR